ncbi:MAG: DUF4920 domain-containing protein [Fodinibius sp.]|nr:DUF4920 domain-containing protein [Fodinibius sp.]
MKRYLLFVLIFGIASVSFAQQSNKKEVISLSDPVETTDDYEVYGSKFEASEQPLSLENLLAKSDTYKNKQVVAKGKIKQVCQKKGCFFMLADGEREARITFKDYAFFIPTNTAGKKVVLKGTFNVKELAEKKAKHYAEDAGEDPEKVKGAQQEYSLVATSVKIMK